MNPAAANDAAPPPPAAAAPPIVEHELELKFTVPAAQRAAVLAALRAAGAQQSRLQAQYFDTADGTLAAHRLALRLRKEGRRWLQTLKADVDASGLRFEHNLPRRTPAGAPPALDVHLHHGTPAGDRLQAALAAAAADGAGDASLRAVYATDIRRKAVTIAVEADAGDAPDAAGRIELAFDEGEIGAGDERLPVCELEFEMKSGSPAALLRLAADWLPRHRLWLSRASKAERGLRLARAKPLLPVVKASNARVDTRMDAAALLRACVGACLEQIVPNAEALASGADAPDYVHQLRVGLRRLRSVLRELAPAAGAQLQAERWSATLAETFAQLGAWRDRDAVVATAQARLAAVGAPPVEWPARFTAAPEVSLEDAVRAPAFQLALVELTLWCMDPLALVVALPAEAPDGDAGPALKRLAPKPVQRAKARDVAAAQLTRLHRRIARDARDFDELPVEQQHRTRKRLKRLRYLAEFVAPLFDKRAARKYLAALAPAQEALGDYNDDAVAFALYQEAAAQAPTAWFAVGWFAAHQADAVRRCKKALERVAKTPRFWRR